MKKAEKKSSFALMAYKKVIFIKIEKNKFEILLTSLRKLQGNIKNKNKTKFCAAVNPALKFGLWKNMSF